MNITIPQNGKLKQVNKSDILGNLQGSFCLNLTKILGKIRVTRMIQTTTQTLDTDLTSYPVGFKVFNDGSSTNIWTVAGSKVHVSVGAVANAQFSVDTITNTPVDCDSTLSDIEIFNGGLYVTGNSKLYSRTTGNWGNVAISGAGPWMMTTYGNRLYIAICGASKIYSTSDGSTIVSPTATYALQLDTNYRITFIRASSNRIWIGTVAISGKGYIFEWDGAATQPTRAYRLEAQGALSCAIKDDVPWVVDSNGKLLSYSNGSFVEIDRLPVDERFLASATSTVNDRFIHPNGMSVVEGKINILINNLLADSAGSIPEFCPSGIWEYDNDIGLYHKYALSYLTVNTNTITDYGQNRLSGVGGLSEMKLSNTASNATGNLLAGATVFKNASITDVGIFTTDTFIPTSGSIGTYSTNGSGYFVTSKFFSPNILDTWQNIYVYFKKLVTSTSKITLKYRTSESIALNISMTWLNTTSFTTTTNVLGLKGYEVEITQGTGSGQTAHITKIDVTAGVYTVYLDETFTGVTTGTGKARIQNWIKIKNGITDQLIQLKGFAIGKASTWMQIKVCMIFKNSDELEMVKLISKVHQYVA